MTWQPRPEMGSLRTRHPRYVAELISEYLGTGGPTRPNQISAISAALGIIVESTTLPDGVRGTLHYEHGSGVVRIAENVPELARSVVLGHELGHLMIDALMQSGRSELRPENLSPLELEKLCDSIAVDLALPPAWIAAMSARVTSMGMEDLHELAIGCGVPRGTFFYAFTRHNYELAWYRGVQRGHGGYRQLTAIARGAGRNALERIPGTLVELSQGYGELPGDTIHMPTWRLLTYRKQSSIEVLAMPRASRAA